MRHHGRAVEKVKSEASAPAVLHCQQPIPAFDASLAAVCRVYTRSQRSLNQCWQTSRDKE